MIQEQDKCRQEALARSTALLGEEAMEKLKGARVAVFGLGGVGGQAFEALLRSGIGALDVVDGDRFQPSNLNRQLLATAKTLGLSKTAAARLRAEELGLPCRLTEWPLYFDERTAGVFPFQAYDYIVDAIDSVPSKLLLIEKAREWNVPIISSMGTGGRLDPEGLTVCDLFETSGCPLARVRRRECRARGIDRLTVVCSPAEPIAPMPASSSFVPPAAGLLLASRVVQELLKGQVKAPAAADAPAMEAFLKESGMHPDCICPEKEIAAFKKALEQGLTPSGSCLEMLPTYLSAFEGRLRPGEEVIVLDAGGTSLRIARVSFREDGRLVLQDQTRQPMPGSLEPLTKETFLEALTEALRPYLGQDALLAFCFSYPARIGEDKDGVVMAPLNKGVRIEGVVGMHVCRELEEALTRAGIPGKRRYILLNDSVACAAGALPFYDRTRYDGLIGFILGTGTNCCFEEACAGHTRYGTLPGESMLINAEAGAYDGFPVGRGDALLHQRDPQPGIHRFEKMIGGAYLGRLARCTAELAAEAGLFSPGFTAALAGVPDFTTRELGEFLTDPRKGPLAALCETETDRGALSLLILRLAERAALCTAVMFTAICEHRGWGRDPKRPALIAAEGSTFWRFGPYFPALEARLERFGRERGVFTEIRALDNPNMAGSAAAALLNL